jgi:hypothetical protein
VQNRATLNIFKERSRLQVQPRPKPAAECEVQLGEYRVRVEIKALRLLLKMREQAFKPKHSQVVKSDVYFIEGFRNNFMD